MSMRFLKTGWIRIVGMAGIIATISSTGAHAEEFRMVDGNTADSCLTGSRSQFRTLKGMNEFTVAQSDKDNLTVAVCVSGESDSAVTLRYKTTDGDWKTSQPFRDACGEVSKVSAVSAKNTETGPDDSSKIYTCIKQ